MDFGCLQCFKIRVAVSCTLGKIFKKSYTIEKQFEFTKFDLFFKNQRVTCSHTTTMDLQINPLGDRGMINLPNYAPEAGPKN